MNIVNPNFFNSALTGLNYAQTALAVVSNNISNSSVAGYTREVVTNVDPSGGGAGGVIVGERQTSTYLNANLLNAQTSASEQGAYAQQATQLNQILASSSATGSSSTIATDIGGAIQNFFSSINALATSTGDSTNAARSSVLTNANVLTAEFSSVGTQLNGLGSQVEQNIKSDIGSINNLATQIAKVNQSIQTNNGSSVIQPANALMDQRDQLLQQLSKLISVSTLPQNDGTYSVFIGEGQPLVLGGTAQSLSAAPLVSDPSKTILSYSSPNGPVSIPDNQIIGGELGALVHFRSQTLVPTQQTLGHLATSFALTINNQLQLGKDKNGNFGANMFNLPLIPSIAVSTNTGNGVLKVAMTDPKQTQASDYSVKYDGSNYSITRLSDNTTTTLPSDLATTPQTVDGLQFSLNSGAMLAGDSIIVYPYKQNVGGVSVSMTDPAKIGAAGGTNGVASGTVSVTTNSSNTGTGSLAITGINGTLATNLPYNSAIVKFVDATHYQVEQGSNGYGPSTLVSNNQISVNGISMTLSGIPAANDTFNMSTNISGAGDNSNAVALHALQTSNTLLGGTTNFSTYYSSISSTVGLAGQQYQATSQAANYALTSATTAQQTVSGVNLDEEASSLLNYQRQYQAAAKVITVSQTLFQSLLQI